MTTRSNVLLLLFVLFLMVLTGGCETKGKAPEADTSARLGRVEPPLPAPPPELLLTQQAFIQVADKVTPAVVNIRAAHLRPGTRLGPLFEEFFGDLFPRRPAPSRKEQSLGSGFIVSADGLILTNGHVVENAEELKIRLSDQRVYDGEVVGIDPRTDVAVVRIHPEGKLPVVVLGDSDDLKVGQWALAIGNPFGLDRTLTVGVISATGRANIGIEDYEDFIQTDASINPGNSGGPLLNIYGEVVGVNTAIVSSGQGIGFAIPINLAKLISDQLIEKGAVTRGWLGVSIQPLTPDLAASFGLDKPSGVLVNEVQPDSPAFRAGVKRGDILLLYGGKEIRGVRQLQLLVASTPAESSVTLKILREGKKLSLPVNISAQDELSAAGGAASPSLGLKVVPADKGTGVLVDAVDPESRAAAAGIRPGDLILSINRQEIADLASFRAAVEEIKQGQTVVLLLRRDETTLYLAFPAS